MQRKKLVKTLCKVSTLNRNKAILKDLQTVKIDSNATESVERQIAHYEDIYNTNKPIHDKYIKRGKKYEKGQGRALLVIGLILTCTIIGAPIGIPMIAAAPSEMDYEYMKKYENYFKNPNKEEYYCDLFAGMYNLPLSFTLGYKKRDFVANEIPQETLNHLAEAERNMYSLMQSTYPTLSERNYTAYTIAKNILESGAKIPTETRDYCNWVVANYSNIAKTDIKTNYNKGAFDPNEAEDLDKHVQNLINNNAIEVTESYKM
jgi:hypothetical protein